MPAAAIQPHDREVGFASGAALLVRREAWQQAGGFDPDYFLYCEDVDLCLRLRLAGWRIGATPRARVDHAYEFDKGPYKWFYLERNRWWTVLADYPAAVLTIAAPALVALELALLLVAARQGWLKPKLKAQLAVLRTLRKTLARRRAVQATRTITARQFADALTESLDSPHIPAPKALDRAQRAYWHTARRLLR
jgi:GT2 family glycosyltransferase